MSENPNTVPTNFDDLQRPEVVAERHPHLFSKWGLIRECRQAEHNGMADFHVVVRFKGKTFINVPAFLRWFEARHVRKSA